MEEGAAAKRALVVGSRRRMWVVSFVPDRGHGMAVSRMRRRAVKISREGEEGEVQDAARWPRVLVRGGIE